MKKLIIYICLLNFILIGASDENKTEDFVEITYKIYELNEDKSQITQIDFPHYLHIDDIDVKKIFLNDSENKIETMRNLLTEQPRIENMKREKFKEFFKIETHYDMFSFLFDYNYQGKTGFGILINKKYIISYNSYDNEAKLEEIYLKNESNKNDSNSNQEWISWNFSENFVDDEANIMHVDLFFLEPVFEKACKDFIEDYQKYTQDSLDAIKSIIEEGGNLDPRININNFFSKENKGKYNYILYVILAALGVSGFALWKKGMIEVKLNINPQN
jgi:hypothetical protein